MKYNKMTDDDLKIMFVNHKVQLLVMDSNKAYVIGF